MALRFIARSLETGVDGPARGVAYAWAGAEDAVFWALREYPREGVRRALTCLIPPPFSPPIVPFGDGPTMLDPRLRDEARVRFGERIVPILLLDRSREVRRRARLAGVLSRLPAVEVSFWNPWHRVLLAEAERYEDEGQFPVFEWTDWPTDREARRMVDALRADDVPMALLDEALDYVLNPDLSPEDRDWVQYSALAVRETSPARWHHIMGRAAEAGDLELAAGVLEVRNQPTEIHAMALRAFPEEPAVCGAALASKTVRDDPRALAVLRASTNPHVLYALARVSTAVTRQAFLALLGADPDRALRLVEESRGTTFTLRSNDWSRVLEHPDPSIRVRASALTGNSGPLRLQPA